MQQAEVFHAFPSNGASFVSRRFASGYVEPMLARNQHFVTIQPKAMFNDYFVASFSRDLVPSDASLGGVTITSGSTKLIYALNDNVVPSIGGPIEFHTTTGHETADLFASTSQFTGAIPTFGTTKVKNPNRRLLFLLHGVFMFLAWCVLSPLGVFVARFMKVLLSTSWFKLHVGLMFVGATVFTAVAYGLIYWCIELDGYKHFDITAFNAVGSFHIVHLFNLVWWLVCLDLDFSTAH